MISGQNAAIRAWPSAVRSRRLPEGVPQSWRPREHALELGQVGKGAPRGLARPNENFIFFFGYSKWQGRLEAGYFDDRIWVRVRVRVSPLVWKV